MFPLSSPTKISVPFVSLEVNGVTCKFLGDSGVSVNIVSNDLSKMFDSVLKPCDTKVCAFNSSNPLSILGKFKALVESYCCSVDSEFLVVDGKTSLLGYAAAPDLGILQIANAASVERRVLQNYPSLFSGLGKMKNVQVKLHINENVKPMHQSQRHIPFHQLKILKLVWNLCCNRISLSRLMDPLSGYLLWFRCPSPDKPSSVSSVLPF